MSREAMLTAIRRGLKRGKLPADQLAMLRMRLATHPRQVVPARGQRDAAGRVTLFAEYVEREFGTAARLASAVEVPGAILAYLTAQHLRPELVVSPHPELQAIPFAATPELRVRFGLAQAADQNCLTLAFAGIAETGTLMLPSGPERPTANNLLPDTALVLVNAADICASYEDAFDRLRAAGAMPRNVMLVTGPSRSADIEQVLELGAHGPRRLHVLILG